MSNKKHSIPVAAPALVGREKEYVLDCLETNWISSTGQYIGRFERAFAEFCGMPHAMSCSNGTVALHLALLALDIKPGDEVIVPTLTYVATANAVAYCGATPVFVDAETETWNLDPAQIAAKITPRTRGIIVVHVYGHPADMDPILVLAQQHGLFVIEDAAEAHGARYKGRIAGSMGHISTFSFYGNKIITTGEGGMVVTADAELARKVRLLKGQGMDPNRRYWFPVTGYNYRMTNIAAAIGLGQLERISWHLSRRREIAAGYTQRLSHCPQLLLPPEKEWAHNAYWIYSVVLTDTCVMSRDDVMAHLAADGIETRPFFVPMHSLPMFATLARGEKFPVADRLAARGINLPSSASLSEEDQTFVCERLLTLVQG
ncbi:MAG: DegT/DnrJ/EryC1/StrS family aminotransferase [bacterium]